MHMLCDLIFAMRTAPGQDRANPVPDMQRCKNSERIALRLIYGMFNPDALRDGLPLFKCYWTPIPIAGDGAKHVGRASALASACADKCKAPVPIAVRLQIIALGAFHPERNGYGSLLRAAQHGVLVFEESGGGGEGCLGVILPPNGVIHGKIK